MTARTLNDQVRDPASGQITTIGALHSAGRLRPNAARVHKSGRLSFWAELPELDDDRGGTTAFQVTRTLFTAMGGRTDKV